MKNVLLAILAYISLCLAGLFFGTTDKLYNHFIFIIIGIGLFFLYKTSFEKVTRRRLIVAIPFAFVLSCLFVIGRVFDIAKTIAALKLIHIVYIIVLTVLLTALFIILMDFIDNYKQDLTKQKNIKKLFRNSKINYILLAILFIICMLPTFLAFYPGVFTTDAYVQIRYVLDGAISAHHPILHTIILYFFYYLGQFFSNVNFGIALYTLTQIISLAIAFSYTIYVMKKNKINDYFIIFTIIILALSPLNGIIGSFITKDVYFSALFLIIVSTLMDRLWNKNEKQKLYKNILLCLAMILFCLFRNQGVYVLAFFLLFQIIGNRKDKELIILSMIAIVLSVFFSFCLEMITNAKKGSIGEMLSLPLQQIASVVVTDEYLLNDTQRELIYNIVPKEDFEGYIPYVSDPIKAHVNEEYFKSHLLDFIKLWINLGIENPKNYIDAFLYLTYGYWYIDINMPHWNAYLPYDDSGNKLAKELGIYYDSKLPIYEESAKYNLMLARFQRYPIISTFTSTAVGFVSLIILFMLIVYKKTYKYILVLSIIIGLWGTVMLGPVIGIRYAYPLIIASPLIISIIFKIGSEEKNR